MIVVPYLKIFTCHESSLRRVREKLEDANSENILAKDFINLCESDLDGLNWAEQMDLMREACGNNTKTYCGRVTVTGKHYILYPDQRDNVTLPQLRELTMAWARRYFADYQVAVIYHDASEACGTHSHIVVNSTNMEDGHRISSDLTPKRVRQMNIALQRLAVEHGMRGFSADHESLTIKEMNDLGKEISTFWDDDEEES